MCVARRKDNLKYRYGITEETYEKMLKDQDHCCAICKEKPKKHLAVDHCHETGKIRGLLCMNCNKGLGMFKDDENRMNKAIQYLAFNTTVEDFILHGRSYIPKDMDSTITESGLNHP